MRSSLCRASDFSSAGRSNTMSVGERQANRDVLRRTVKVPRARDGDDKEIHVPQQLRLMMLGCEDNPPYGPYESTAALFLDLICRAMIESANRRHGHVKDDCDVVTVDVSIAIYRAKIQDYPSDPNEWDSYDGLLLPGSSSSAHAQEDWIERLKEVIQTEVHGKQRKTLAVCFGHQVYSHSFRGRAGEESEKDSTDNGGTPRGNIGGLATTCPAGMQAGRRTFRTTSEGHALLISPGFKCHDKENNPEADDQIQLLYTHGDMVKTLPSCAVSLGGNEKVPIQAAAYFASEAEAQQYRDGYALGREGLPTPYAFTFQAHPEYASEDGLNGTFANTLSVLEDRGEVPKLELDEAMRDAETHFLLICNHSLEVMIAVGSSLGWM